MGINRRHFITSSTLAISALSISKTSQARTNAIWLGGPVFDKYNSPEEWVQIVKKEGYAAAYCPVSPGTDQDVIKAYEKAAKEADIIIAEVGAWSNPISPNEEERKNAIEKNKNCLQLADDIGANCCVNISGSRGENWAGHDPKNLTEETFDLIVETTRDIIDTVKPKRTFYTLETMPWAYPNSPDTYVRLIEAIDRKGFAAHMDPVNIVNSPDRYYSTTDLIKECFEKFGEHIKSCHAKDITMSQNLTVHLDEIRPGLGNLDYVVYMKELRKLDNIPLMLEHLPSADEYRQAAKHLRKVAQENNIDLA